MTIAVGKKRYSLTLTKATWDRLQEQFSEVGATRASGLISLMVDEYLSTMAAHILPAIKKAKDEKRDITQAEFFRMILGTFGDSVGKETYEEPPQETATVEKRDRRKRL